MLGDRPSVDDRGRPAHEELEDVVLGHGKRQRPTVHRRHARDGVQRDPAAGDDRGVNAARTALERTNSRQQLTEVERLDEVVVRPGIQPRDSVGRRVSRGEHQERGRPVVAARPAHHVDPRGAGHPPVEDGHVVLVELQLVDRIVAAFHGIDTESVVLQAQDEDLAE